MREKQAGYDEADVESIETATRMAVVAGATLEGAVEAHDRGRIAHLAAPFGHGFCLIQFRGRGYDGIAA